MRIFALGLAESHSTDQERYRGFRVLNISHERASLYEKGRAIAGPPPSPNWDVRASSLQPVYAFANQDIDRDASVLRLACVG